MQEPLKNLYNKGSISEISKFISTHYPAFNSNQFTADVFDGSWKNLELKQRTNHVTKCLHKHLPQNVEESFPIIIKASKTSEESKGFYCIIFSEFMGLYGKDHLKLSLKGLKETTSSCTAEFAIRPFIEEHQETTFEYLYAWAKDENHHVRRLASEGCRPLLPWGQKLHNLVNDPNPILPILEQLKNDPEKYVQKSVANNINDISKHHPDLILDLMEKWYGENSITDWIVKHGLRTLLKKGNKRALNLFGLNEKISVALSGWSAASSTVKIGEEYAFSCNVTLQEKEAHDVRFEYAIDYLKSNGSHNRKVFQLGTKKCKANQTINLKKKQSFKNMTTRKHYAGEHKIHILANGQVIHSHNFTVI